MPYNPMMPGQMNPQTQMQRPMQPQGMPQQQRGWGPPRPSQKMAIDALTQIAMGRGGFPPQQQRPMMPQGMPSQGMPPSPGFTQQRILPQRMPMPMTAPGPSGASSLLGLPNQLAKPPARSLLGM